MIGQGGCTRAPSTVLCARLLGRLPARKEESTACERSTMLLFSSARSATGALKIMRLLVMYCQPSGMGCGGGSIEDGGGEGGCVQRGGRAADVQRLSRGVGLAAGGGVVAESPFQ